MHHGRVMGMMRGIASPYSTLDLIGTAVLSERQNRKSFFSLLPEDVLRVRCSRTMFLFLTFIQVSLFAFGARSFKVIDTSNGSAGADHQLFVQVAHGIYQISVR
jgi:hypothetical protein